MPRALISVSDKRGIVEFSRGIASLGFEIVSTGGTAALLRESGLPVTTVEDVTHFPECLDGRVKTLHPHIHGGILAMRDRPAHIQTLHTLAITPIDLVVVNLYPFRQVVEDPAHTLEQAIENIDIGGPSMIRAAAKNYKHVTVVVEDKDYNTVLEKLRDGTLDTGFRFELAAKAFAHTAAYDAMVSGYLNGLTKPDGYPDILTLTFEKTQDLRYGENSHQTAAYYRSPLSSGGVGTCLHGKELSYNNIGDANSAIALAYEFSEPACVAVKHATPCGAAIGTDPLDAFTKAYEADPVSIYGGIVCFNREVDKRTAERLREVFLEVIIAPAYSAEALTVLTQKKNLRLLLLPALSGSRGSESPVLRSVDGGLLIQQADTSVIDDEQPRVVTEKSPSTEEMRDILFAMKVVKHVKSNAVVVAKDGRTLGIGGGEVSRIWAAEAALVRAGAACENAVLASDAFFPFPDVVEVCGAHKISAIIQPGGSKNDGLSIEACNRQGIAMVFTGVRHFRH